MDKKVVLITGASSGIGKAAAELLMARGYRVYGTSRRQSEEELKDGNSGGFIHMVQMDVCAIDSVDKAIKYVLQREDTIDVLVNCAGFGIAGSVEDTSPEEAYKQFDTNFFGTHRMIRSILPVMRRQGSGVIINVSSVAGLISIPFQSMYSASKYAIEAMTEALRMEVKPFGIKVSLVEPGDTRTGFTEKREYTASAKDNPAYREKFIKAIGSMEKSELSGPGPETVARVIVKLIEKKNPPVRVAVGISYKAIAFLKRVLPAKVVEYIVSKIY